MSPDDLIREWETAGTSPHQVIQRAYDDDRWAWGNDPEREAIEVDALCTLIAREPAMVHRVDPRGRTLLHAIADELGHVDEDCRAEGEQLLVRVLDACIERGADVNARDEDGMGPLFFAESPRWMTYLLAAGADPNAATNAGATVLMHAVQDVDRVRTLLAHGADPARRDPRGKTARDWALHYEAIATVALLDAWARPPAP